MKKIIILLCLLTSTIFAQLPPEILYSSSGVVAASGWWNNYKNLLVSAWPAHEGRGTVLYDKISGTNMTLSASVWTNVNGVICFGSPVTNVPPHGIYTATCSGIGASAPWHKGTNSILSGCWVYSLTNGNSVILFGLQSPAGANNEYGLQGNNATTYMEGCSYISLNAGTFPFQYGSWNLLTVSIINSGPTNGVSGNPNACMQTNIATFYLNGIQVNASGISVNTNNMRYGYQWVLGGQGNYNMPNTYFGDAFMAYPNGYTVAQASNLQNQIYQSTRSIYGK